MTSFIDVERTVLLIVIAVSLVPAFWVLGRTTIRARTIWQRPCHQVGIERSVVSLRLKVLRSRMISGRIDLPGQADIMTLQFDRIAS